MAFLGCAVGSSLESMLQEADRKQAAAASGPSASVPSSRGTGGNAESEQAFERLIRGFAVARKPEPAAAAAAAAAAGEKVLGRRASAEGRETEMEMETEMPGRRGSSGADWIPAVPSSNDAAGRSAPRAADFASFDDYMAALRDAAMSQPRPYSHGTGAGTGAGRGSRGGRGYAAQSQGRTEGDNRSDGGGKGSTRCPREDSESFLEPRAALPSVSVVTPAKTSVSSAAAAVLAAAAVPHLNKLRKAELQEMLKKNNLPVSGNKAELFQRLQEHGVV
jgi:hypothetical protein